MLVQRFCSTSFLVGSVYLGLGLQFPGLGSPPVKLSLPPRPSQVTRIVSGTSLSHTLFFSWFRPGERGGTDWACLDSSVHSVLPSRELLKD